MATYADLVAFARTLAVRLGNGKEKAEAAEGWTTCCPVPSHGKGNGDQNPSLSIYVDQSIRFKCWSGCSDEAIRQALADLGYRNIPELDRSRGGGKGIITNKIAHADIVDDEWLMAEWQDLPNKLYTYRNAEGRPVFFVARFDKNPPKYPDKAIRPICSARLKGGGKKDFWIKQAYPVPRPIYNLDRIAARPDATILVVEGEKAADAAAEIFPDYVVTTWQGGSSAYKQSVWAALQSRNVILWPDNDAPGLSAMRGLGAMLAKGSKAAASVSQVFDETQDDLIEGWDLADYDQDINPSPNDFIESAVYLDASKLPDTPAPADEEEQEKRLQGFLDKYVGVLRSDGGHDYIDLTSCSPLVTTHTPYRVFSKQTLLDVETDNFIYFENGNQRSRGRRRKFIELYLESSRKRWFDGYSYDPTITDRVVQLGGRLRLNLFCGLAHPPLPCDPSLYQPFIDHIYASCENRDQAEYLLDWLAFKFQFPGRMIGTMAILSGRQGCGKTVVCDIISAILGRHNAVKIGMGELKAQFNSQYANKLFIEVEEYNPGNSARELRDKVKNLVTSETMIVNPKGVPAYENSCYHSIIATTNSPTPEEIGFDNRRMTFLRFDNLTLAMNGSTIFDPSYFAPLYRLKESPEALSGLCHWLSKRQINDRVTKPLDTELTTVAKGFVDEPVYAFLKALAWDGTFPPTDLMPESTDNTNNPYSISKWPRQACALPRQTLTTMFQKFCIDEGHGSITRIKAGRWLLNALLQTTKLNDATTYQYPRGITEAGVGITKTRRWKMVTQQGFSSELRDLPICIPDIGELRAMLEAKAGVPIKWPTRSADGEPLGAVILDFPW